MDIENLVEAEVLRVVRRERSSCSCLFVVLRQVYDQFMFVVNKGP